MRRGRLPGPRSALFLAFAGALAGALGLASGASPGLQHQATDLLQPGTASSDEIVVVAIDRGTLADVGEPWPWPRSQHAELITAIGAGDPRVVAYDVLFADHRPGDNGLADAIAGSRVALPIALTLDVGEEPPVATDLVGLVEPLTGAAAATGHANVTTSPDRGVVRELPFYASDQRGLVIPSLVLATLGVGDGNTGPVIERTGGVQVGARFIPLEGGALRINWADGLRGADDLVSAVDVLAGDVDPDFFRDRHVLVGVTEPTFGDLHLVPIDKSGATPGLLVHANALNTILQGAYLTEVGAGLQLAVLVLLAMLSAWCYLRAALWVGGTVTVAFLASVLAWSSWRFHTAGELWNVVWPMVTLVVVAIGGFAVRYFSEIRHRRRATTLFAQYVPAGTLDELSEPGALARATAGERLEILVLFCDLRGFTPTAATLTPIRVRELLNAYYDYAVSTILNHRGTVMQFVGDEVFAVFGAPVPEGDDTERALECARSLIERVSTLDSTLAERDLPQLRFGIGLHRGPVVAAHVGSEHRRQYSVIGDTVNVGSRLCGQAGPGEVVISTAVTDLLPPDATTHAEDIPDLDLKGVLRTVRAVRLKSRAAAPAD